MPPTSRGPSRAAAANPSRTAVNGRPPALPIRPARRSSSWAQPTPGIPTATAGNKVARAEIAMIKVAVPAMLSKVADMAIQAHGGAGVTDDFGLGFTYATARTLRIVDGPDEVHRNQIGRIELAKYN